MQSIRIQNINIARIAKAASHKLLGKSSLDVSFACPVLPMFTTTTATTMTMATKMTMASWKFYEKVGGCTQERNLSIAPIDRHES